MNSLVTTTSRFAIAAAAGMFMGSLALTPAQAADLGGDCCADLEERVAELEATTVRKGNRKVSVKLSGQINQLMLYWNDGEADDVYIVDNTESSTRFRFTGAAKFRPGWSAGFLLEIEAEHGRSFNVDQIEDDRPNNNADGSLEMRKAAWWLKSDRLGEIWLGRYSPATDDIKLLNIAGTPNVDASLETGAGFFLRAPEGTGGCSGSGCLYNIRLGEIAPSGDTRRGNIIRYNTPSLKGLVFSVSWGEDDISDVAVRYRKQWNSIQVVGGVGYHWDTDETETEQLTCGSYEPSLLDEGTFRSTGVRLIGSNNGNIGNTSINNPGVATGGGLGAGYLQADDLATGCRDYRYDLERLAGSFSAMHTPSGLYAYFGGHRDQLKDFSTYSPNGAGQASQHFQRRSVPGETEPDTETHWYVQAGIKRRMGPLKNLGATTVYGEYQEWDGAREDTFNLAFGPGTRDTAPGNLNYINALAQNDPQLAIYTQTDPNRRLFTNGTVMTDTEVTSWGFGMVQNIDKAAMQLWLSYRYFDPDVRTQTVYNAGLECLVPQGARFAEFGNNGALLRRQRTGGGGDGACRAAAPANQLPQTVVNWEHAIEDIWTIQFGGKLQF